METFKYYTINVLSNYYASHGMKYAVYGWGEYPDYSVMAGQPRKCFIESYETIEAARKEYPEAKMSSKWTEPEVTFDHLPGEDDPVPGGMYPDDYDDGI